MVFSNFDFDLGFENVPVPAYTHFQSDAMLRQRLEQEVASYKPSQTTTSPSLEIDFSPKDDTQLKFTQIYEIQETEESEEDLDKIVSDLLGQNDEDPQPLRWSKLFGVSGSDTLHKFCTEKAVEEMNTLWNKRSKRLSMPFFSSNDKSHKEEEEGGEEQEAKPLADLYPNNTSEVLGRYSWKTCALIGNSAGLTIGPNYGAAIEGHDQVIRLNQAPTNRYHKYVGTKTTFRLLNRQWVLGYADKMDRRMYGTIKWEELPLEKTVTLLATRGNAPAYRVLHNFVSSRRKDVQLLRMNFKLYRVATSVLKMFRECMETKKMRGPGGVKNARFSGGSTPSTGIMTAMLLARECTKLRVYGFGSAPQGRYQYYTLAGTQRAAGVSVHSFDAELSLLQGFANAGVLTLCGPHHVFDECRKP
ncbi:hypothetical protein CYMTET_55698 [Cymbomonas tetramitiformis]|uniref:Uncharacterized protein n=1 Tax=Cymbomonas tetramitiformis TaxID=36881 RepID=A0AAE0EMJ9_9CHLO|nr:hypothetical protein CYMTET_55698 [Cymbomonas tetramitiformis]